MIPALSSSGAPMTWIDILVQTYVRAQDKLKAIVLHPPGGTEKAQQYNAARAANQLQQIERLIAGLRTEAASWVGSVMPIAYSDGIRRAEEQAAKIGAESRVLGVGSAESRVLGAGKASAESGVLSAGSEFSTQHPALSTSSLGTLRPSFSLIEIDTLKVLAKDTYADLNKAATSMGDRAARVLRATRQVGLSESDINRVLAGGVIEGKPAETIRTLREELRRVHGDEVQVIDKNGAPINIKVGYYAEMVARTKTREANQKAKLGRQQQLGLDLVAVIGRISKNFCTAYLGQVFSISGKSDKYPAYSSLPGGGAPFHPFCSKSTRPFVEDLASEKQLQNAEGDEDSDSFLNIDATTAQRRFKDLQVFQRVKERYAKTG
jgi:hypothetical protein